MSRCRICNWEYDTNFLPHFPGESYCQVCEIEILICLREMEELDEEEEDDNSCK